MSGDNLVISDACPSECLPLDRISRGCGPLMMARTLILDGMPRLAVLVHQEQIHALRVDAAVRFPILAAENFSQGDLSHYLPSWVTGDDGTVQFLEKAGLAFVQDRLNRKDCPHHDAELICCVGLALGRSFA